MGRVGVDLDDVHAQAGGNRRNRKAFLLGSWRTRTSELVALYAGSYGKAYGACRP